jgi:hypothetical protein
MPGIQPRERSDGGNPGQTSGFFDRIEFPSSPLLPAAAPAVHDDSIFRNPYPVSHSRTHIRLSLTLEESSRSCRADVSTRVVVVKRYIGNPCVRQPTDPFKLSPSRLRLYRNCERDRRFYNSPWHEFCNISEESDGKTKQNCSTQNDSLLPNDSGFSRQWQSRQRRRFALLCFPLLLPPCLELQTPTT